MEISNKRLGKNILIHTDYLNQKFSTSWLAWTPLSEEELFLAAYKMYNIVNVYKCT